LGGVATAGLLVYVFDDTQYRKDRAMLGFAGSTIIGIAMQVVDYAEYKDIQGQLTDAAWHIVGSAIGAYTTDKFILSPVVENSPSEGKYVGLTLQSSF
jgi:hypothetical protein